MYPTATIAMIQPVQPALAQPKAAMGSTMIVTTASTRPMRAAVQPTTEILTEMDMEVRPTHSVCVHLPAITMSPTTTIATTQTETHVQDKARGSAAIGVMETSIMTAMAPKPKGTTVEADAADGLAVPPTMAGTAEIHPVETTVLG